MTTPGEPAIADGCAQCRHPFGPHMMVAFGNPLDGGIILCPEPGCDCVSTWDVPQAHPGAPRNAPVMPPREVVAGYRAAVLPRQPRIAFDRPGHPAFKRRDIDENEVDPRG